MFFANLLHVFQTAQLWGSPQVHALPVLCLRLIVQVSSCLKEINASCDRWHMIPRESQLGEGIKMTILHLWSERNDAATCAWPNFPASAPLRILTLLRHLARDTGIGLGRRFHRIFQKFFRSAKSFTVIQSSLNHLAEAIAGVYLSSTSALVSALVGRAYRGMIRKACRHVFGVWEWSTLTNCRAMSVADAVSRFKEQAGSGVKLENQCLSSDIIHPKPPKSSWLEALAHCLWGGQLRVECHAMLAMPSYEAFPGFQANASLQAYLNFDPHAESEVCNKADQSCIETGKKMKVLNVSTYASWCSIIKPTWIRLPFTFFNM